MKKRLSIVALALVAGSLNAQTVIGKGGLLSDTAGKVLYVFDKDSDGKSTCYDACAALWPPYLATADARAAGDLRLVSRSDGSRQWAWRGQPLYYYAGDSAPGQAAGDGLKGVWHVVREGSVTADPGGYRPKDY